jgi:hypothetical protein
MGGLTVLVVVRHDVVRWIGRKGWKLPKVVYGLVSVDDDCLLSVNRIKCERGIYIPTPRLQNRLQNHDIMVATSTKPPVLSYETHPRANSGVTNQSIGQGVDHEEPLDRIKSYTI